MSRLTILTLAIGLLVSAPMVRADSITIDAITDGWANPVLENPAFGVSLFISNVANPGTDRIRWGHGNSPSSSGYNWNSTNTTFTVATDTLFSLGTFTHLNNPIPLESSITSVDLNFVVGNFETPATISATFLFTHEETPNNTLTGPCLYPSTIPCADSVTISNAFFNTLFRDNGGQQYFFSLLGFSTDGGVTISNQFITQEALDNNADLYAVITVEPLPGPGIPEPTSLILLGTGLGALGLAALRRKK